MAAEVDRHRNRRLFGGFLGWLMYDGRRPVMVGAAVPFAGRTRVGKAVLRRADSQLEVTQDGSTLKMVAVDPLTMVGAGDFFPRPLAPHGGRGQRPRCQTTVESWLPGDDPKSEGISDPAPEAFRHRFRQARARGGGRPSWAYNKPTVGSLSTRRTGVSVIVDAWAQLPTPGSWRSRGGTRSVGGPAPNAPR